MDQSSRKVGRFFIPVFLRETDLYFVCTGLDYDPHAKYNFGYAVNDPYHGDFHSHHEEKDGGVVKGQYSLVEKDGVR